MMEIVQRRQDRAYQAAEKATKDDVGCDYVNPASEAPGSVESCFSCGRNVGQLDLTGALTHAEK